MIANDKKAFLAFISGIGYCWLTSLAVWLGDAAFWTVISRFVHNYNAIVLSVAILFFWILIP